MTSPRPTSLRFDPGDGDVPLYLGEHEPPGEGCSRGCVFEGFCGLGFVLAVFLVASAVLFAVGLLLTSLLR